MRRIVTRRWKSNFARFIRSYGVELLALEIEVHPSAIYHWIRGATTPRPAYAEVINELPANLDSPSRWTRSMGTPVRFVQTSTWNRG
jgi:hypothetical protein